MKLVCIGDSLTFGFKMTRNNSWPQIIEENLKIEVKNEGVCGDTTSGMLSRFRHDVVDKKPTHVLIMGGSNDLIFQLSKSVIYSNLATMIYQAYHYRIEPILGVPIPIITSIAEQNLNLPGDLKGVNKEIKLLRDWILHYSHSQQIKTVDFFNGFYDPINKKGKESLYIDGIHPTIDGNKQMGQSVIEIINKHIF